MKPYYEHAGITIYHADSLELMGDMANDSADLVFTDPPYGVKKRLRSYGKILGPPVTWDDDFPEIWFEHADRLAPVVAFTPGIVNLLMCPWRFILASYRWTLAVHVANGMTRGPFGYGNWIPCMVYARGDVNLYSQQNDIGRVSIAAGDKPDHECPKPLPAVEWFLSRLPGSRILDPFCGSGTTLVAAKQAGRTAIGIDIEERYCEIAAKRLAQEVLPLSTDGSDEP